MSDQQPTTRRAARAAERAARDAAGIDEFAEERAAFLASGGVIPDGTPAGVGSEEPSPGAPYALPFVAEAAQSYNPVHPFVAEPADAYTPPSPFSAPPAPAYDAASAAPHQQAAADQPWAIVAPAGAAPAAEPAAWDPTPQAETDWGAEPSADELFNYGTPDDSNNPAVVYADDERPDSDEPAAPAQPQRKAPKPPAETKGVNLWAVFAILAAATSAAGLFVQPLALTAPYLGYGAVAIAVIAVLLPGFKRLQSVIALVLALAAGGYQGYVNFIATPDADTTPAPAAVVPEEDKTSTLTFTLTGAGEADVTYSIVNRGVPSQDAPGRVSAPWTLEVPVAPETDGVSSFTLNVAPTDVPLTCTIALDGVELTRAESTAGVPLICAASTTPPASGEPAVEVPAA